MNIVTQIGIALFAVFVLFSMTSQCSRSNSSRAQITPEATEIILKEYSKGLNLAAVTELAKKSKDAEEFEKLLNSKSEAVNNIDLNDDYKVDYIEVTEYGSGDARGFSLSTEIESGKTQEIATIDFKRDGEKATVQTTGNSSLYGPGHYHHSSFGVTDALLMYWLFSNRPSYSSPYGYGNYPPTYGGGWVRQDPNGYTRSMTSRTSGSGMKSSSTPVISNPATSPNADKVAAKAKVISSPTQSQKSFSNSTPSASRPTSSGGFGRSSSSGSSRSGGSSGGGK